MFKDLFKKTVEKDLKELKEVMTAEKKDILEMEELVRKMKEIAYAK